MKKTLVTLMLLIAASAVLIPSCKKKTDTPTPAPTPTPANVLCDGKAGNNSYYPLAWGNKWTFKYNYYNGGPDPSSNVNDTLRINSKLYYDVSSVQISSSGSLREDPITHDIYKYYYGDSLLFPGNPTVGQVLPFNRKVISITEAVNTSSCSYTNCLQIAVYGGNGALIGYQYYKKGLGFIYSYDFTLTSVTIN